MNIHLIKRTSFFTVVAGLFLLGLITPLSVFAQHSSADNHNTSLHCQGGCEQTKTDASDCIDQCLALYDSKQAPSVNRSESFVKFFLPINPESFSLIELSDGNRQYDQYILNKRQSSPHTTVQKIE